MQILRCYLWLMIACIVPAIAGAQRNLLLNGDFEDINTCTEYNSECGVEAWFYLRDIKAQMLTNEESLPMLGNNSFAMFFQWHGYTDFAPIIGTLLPCALQKEKAYTFRGMIQAKLDNRLVLQPGIVLGEKFFVPRRPFSATLVPDSINGLTEIKGTHYFKFEYKFTATGKERYLTFGSFVHIDSSGGAMRQLIGTQVISITLDNFELVSEDPEEVACSDFMMDKEKIYAYNFRHKDMDNNLYARGELPIPLPDTDTSFITRKETKAPPPIADTLNLGDVFFDFNKANLKPAAVAVLDKYFSEPVGPASIDSIYIDGHTDSIGSESKNLLLSSDRCASVRDWLIAHQTVAADRLTVRPFGKSKPVASNATAAGRAANRRVELIVFRQRR